MQDKWGNHTIQNIVCLLLILILLDDPILKDKVIE